MHFAIMCINALPPASLDNCSVDSGTLKISPFHMNQDIAVFMSYAVCGRGKICVVYHTVASATSLT